MDANDTNDGRSTQGWQGGDHGGGTTLDDAMFLSSDEVIGKQQGRKALIILSDGDDRGARSPELGD